MRDRKQIREAIEGVTAETGGWDAPPTWIQIFDVLAALLASAQEPIRGSLTREQYMRRYGSVPVGYVGPEESAQAGGEAADARPMLTEWRLDEAAANPATRYFPDGKDVAAIANEVGWMVFGPESTHGSEPIAKGDAKGRTGAERIANAMSGCDAWIRANPILAPGRLPAPRTVPGDAAPAFKPCGKPACGACTDTGVTMGELATDIMANHAAEIGPDALRERAIQIVAANAEDEDESAVRACLSERPNGPTAKAVQRVERALRDVAAPCEEPSEVLAVTSTTVSREFGMFVPPRIDLPADKTADGTRVTVAVLTGSVAGIVEEHKRREEWLGHVAAHDAQGFVVCHCKCDELGGPIPAPDCEDGQRLAAAVNGVGGAK